MKYKTRNEYTISTVSNSKSRENHWITDLENQLQKQAVQPKRVDQSMFEQINGIINGNSKYSSVEDAVKEMQARSGFLDYINKKANDEQQSKDQSKIPSKDGKPKLILLHPNIDLTINNYCDHTSGQQDIPAIIEHVKKIHNKDVKDKSLWDNDDLIKYIFNLNKKFNKNVQELSDELGKLNYNDKDDYVDPGNYDAYHGLMPAKH